MTEHEWIWESTHDDCGCGMGNDMYCFWCHLERDFSIDEEDEPPCKKPRMRENEEESQAK